MTVPNRRWFRFSLTTLFVTVTFGSILIASAVALSMRAASMHRRSQEHMEQAAMFLQVVDGIDRLPSLNAKQQDLREQFSEKSDHHASLSEEYEQAAWRPWVSVNETPSP